MGAFGRAGEKIKQAFGCGVPNDAEWKPTTNARNKMMLKDMKEFSVHVRRMHGDVTMWRDTIARGLNTLKGVLEAELPRAYTETVTGVGPVDPETHIVGQGVRTDVFPTAAETMQNDIQKVLSSLEGWLNSYKEIKARNKKCEVLKFDLDAQHRESAKFADKYQRMTAANKADEDLKFRTMASEDKRNRLAQRYAETEAEVFNALLSMIQDSTALRDYVLESLLNMKIVFETTVNSIDVRAALRSPLLPPMAVPEFRTVATIDHAGGNALGAQLASSALMDNRGSLRMSHGGPPAAAAAPAQPAGKAPKWYDEARSQAGMPTMDDADSDDDGGNPFKQQRKADVKSIKGSEASNPFGPPKTKQANEPSKAPKGKAGAYKA